MIPMGMSMALTVRIGEAKGSGETFRLRPIVVSGWLLVVCYAMASGLSFVLLGRAMAGLFTGDAEVIRLAAMLLVIVGVFQLVDGLQVASAAMLRGLHDARVPALMGLVAYWVVGLPVGSGLAFCIGMGARGVWWGLASGLLVACITLGGRLWLRSGPHVGSMAGQAAVPPA